jgi:hypothetical protein
VATRRSTFGKQDRERAKKARAAAKRERRFDRTPAEEAAEGSGPVATMSVGELLQEIETLHARFADEAISFEDFEERKAELFQTLASLDF